MKSRRIPLNLFSLFFVFIILNSNCLVLLNAVKAQKFASNSTAQVESENNNNDENHHSNHQTHRLKKHSKVSSLMRVTSGHHSNSSKRHHSREIQVGKHAKSEHRRGHSTRLAKTHIDPVTAAIIVKYTAAVITKILDYGTGKVKEYTKNVYQKTITTIENNKNQWRIMLETQCFFFRMIRQITKVYLMSSDYENYLLTKKAYAPLRNTVDKVNDIREKILSFIDQKVLDSCSDIDNYLIDYMQMADGKKKELEEEIRKLSDDHLNTSVNSMDYVIKQIKKNGPKQVTEADEDESVFKKVTDIFSDELENANNIIEDLNGEGNGWKDLMDSQEDKGEKLSESLGLTERADFIKEFNDQMGDWLGNTISVVTKINSIRKEVTESLSREDQEVIGQQAADMEKMRKYVAIATNVFSIVSKIVEWSGGEMPEWAATVEAAFELLEKFLKYKSLVYTRRYVTLNKETKRVLDEEIMKCKVFEIIPAGVKLAALFTGSIALGVLRAVVGPFLDAAINVFKMLVSVYKLVAAIVGYFRAKRETKEIEELLKITSENIQKHYAYEKCSATEQLYEMLNILESERSAATKRAEKMASKVTTRPSETDENNKKLEFMKLAADDDVNIFLSSFSEAEIKSGETLQLSQPDQIPLREKVFYRKYLSAINSIAVAKSSQSLRSLLDDGYTQYIVLNDSTSILVCRGCSSRFAVTSIARIPGKELSDIASEMSSFKTAGGTKRLNIINVGTSENPVYFKVVESKLDTSTEYITDFSLTTSTPVKIDKISSSRYLGEGKFENFASVRALFHAKASLSVTTSPLQNYFGTEKFKFFVKLANIENEKWLVLAFPTTSTKSEETTVVSNLQKITQFDFTTDITDVNCYVLATNTASESSFKPEFEDVKRSFKVGNYLVLSRNLLVRSTQVSTTPTRLDIFDFLRTNVLCNNKCYYRDTPINQAFRINDEDAFASLKNESDDVWTKKTITCPEGQSLDFNLIKKPKDKYEVEAICSSTSENKLQYDSNYIVRSFKDASLSCSPAFGDIGRLRRGFLPLYKFTHKSDGRDVEVYIRPKFEFGWVPLGTTLTDHTEASKNTCWNEFFDPEDLKEEFKTLQSKYDQRCDRNKFLHFIRSYRAYIQLYTHTSVSNPSIKQGGKLPTLKYYRYLRGKYFAAKTGKNFLDYADVKKLESQPLDDETSALLFLSRIHSLCKNKHIFLPAQLEENSTGLTFVKNASDEIFLQETSQKGLSVNIDRVYYIEVFGFKDTNVPNMILTVGENDMQSDHRNLFDFGFRPLLVPASLQSGITDGVLVSSKANNQSKTAFRVWVRDDMRLKNKKADICK